MDSRTAVKALNSAYESGPSDETRRLACLDPVTALRYAQSVDKGYHPDTWGAVKSDFDRWSEYYRVVPGMRVDYLRHNLRGVECPR